MSLLSVGRREEIILLPILVSHENYMVDFDLFSRSLLQSDEEKRPQATDPAVYKW